MAYVAWAYIQNQVRRLRRRLIIVAQPYEFRIAAEAERF